MMTLIMMIISVCTQVSFVSADDVNDFVVDDGDAHKDNDDAPDHDNHEYTQVAFVPAHGVVNHFNFDVIDDAPDHDDYGGVGSLDDLTFDVVEGNNDVRSIFRPVLPKRS